MSNKHIAIKWATTQAKTAGSFVYSDQFFKPFTNLSTRRKIVQELAKQGVIAWTDTKEGAFLFRSGDARLTIESKDGVRVGAWCENGNIMVLPAEYV